MGLLDAALNFGAQALRSGSQAPAQTPEQSAVTATPTRDGNSMSEDNVTLEAQVARQRRGMDLPIKDYKTTVATDADFVKDTLRTKLAELNLSPDTKLAVRKNELGELELDSQLSPEKQTRIENDLNQNRAFKTAFDRLSVNQPTLDYLDNVSRLSQAYGTNNSLFETLISDRGDNNALQDIAHRYDQMRKQLANAQSTAENQRANYEIRVNATA
ncbi:MAG: hypothetical protein EA349_02190 [Halomonadaceae bacterium]|nr:MAG: hypothetical protein EA349_02190 [Halomonadaceae bacterium]